MATTPIPIDATATQSAPPSRFGRRARNEAFWGYALIAPVMLGFAVFFLIALGVSLYLSLTQWDMLTSPVYVGFQNYRTVFNDAEFRTALVNTVAITIPHIVLRLIFALALALALNMNIRYRAFYRILFFLPVLTMPVAIGTIWKWLYDPAFGPINSFLRRIGVTGPEWLSQPRWAVVAIVIVLLWSGVGYDMIIYLAGLQAIPRDYYEAASLDGAGSWQRFRDVTLPLLTPTIFFLSVIGVIFSLQVFDLVYVMTRIGMTNTLPTVVYYVYEEGFTNFRMGYAITVAWVLLAMILVFTIIQFRLQRKWVHYA